MVANIIMAIPLLYLESGEWLLSTCNGLQHHKGLNTRVLELMIFKYFDWFSRDLGCDGNSLKQTSQLSPAIGREIFPSAPISKDGPS